MTGAKQARPMETQAAGTPEAWLEMFLRFFAAPAPETYRPLFHPQGSLQDAGMAEPLPAALTGQAIAMVLAKLPDLRIQALRHRIRGDHVFVEARNAGTLNGTALDWGAVYRVHLRDGLVHRGRRFYDQADLFRPLLPAGAVLPPFDGEAADSLPERSPARQPEAFVRQLEEAWQSADFEGLAALHAAEGRLRAPGLAAPIGRDRIPAWGRHLTGLLNPVGMRVADWAGDEQVLFVEWQAGATMAGQAIPFDRIDRFLFDPQGRILESRCYFDTLAMLEQTHPEVAQIRARIIKG